MTDSSSYPVTLSIDYPTHPLNRMTTFFRIFTVLPIAIVLVLLFHDGSILGLVVLPTILMLVFRQKYPKWWFDWNEQMINFCFRVGAYICLLDDRYPATDQQQNVHIQLTYPDAPNDLNQWLPLVKWLLAVPHYLVLLCFGLAAVIGVVIAWFAILFTQRYPKGIFDFVAAVFRYELRVLAYAFILTTDHYPPFRLD